MSKSITPPIFRAHADPVPMPLVVINGKVSAGQSRFPSPAQDYECKELDLNERFITNPPATFLMTVLGDSMSDIGIYPGTLLIIDRSITPRHNYIVVACVDGERLVKRLYRRGNKIRLMSENPNHLPIDFSEGQELVIFGVVTHYINAAR